MVLLVGKGVTMRIDMRQKALFIICLWSAMVVFSSEFRCDFVSGKWSRSDWVLLKSPRWDYFGDWIQKIDHIENCVPAKATPEELLKKYSAQTYSCMLWKILLKTTKPVEIHSRMSFDDRMAPLIVLSGVYGKDLKNRPELREHWEVVLYDKGLNIWHHEYKDGKPCWYLAAALQATFKANVVYDVQVRMQKVKNNIRMEVFCADQKLTYTSRDFPASFYVGITGCEGLNRFYDFGVKY